MRYGIVRERQVYPDTFQAGIPLCRGVTPIVVHPAEPVSDAEESETRRRPHRQPNFSAGRAGGCEGGDWRCSAAPAAAALRVNLDRASASCGERAQATRYLRVGIVHLKRRGSRPRIWQKVSGWN